MTTPAQVILGD